jgi:hypothetical protein
MLYKLYTVAYFVRQYASSPKVAGSIVKGIIEFFNCPNLSSCSMLLEPTQPPAEISICNLSRGKGSRIIRLTTSDNLEAFSCQWASMARYKDSFTTTFLHNPSVEIKPIKTVVSWTHTLIVAKHNYPFCLCPRCV